LQPWAGGFDIRKIADFDWYCPVHRRDHQVGTRGTAPRTNGKSYSTQDRFLL
jgi:hypothetical protein